MKREIEYVAADNLLYLKATATTASTARRYPIAYLDNDGLKFFTSAKFVYDAPFLALCKHAIGSRTPQAINGAHQSHLMEADMINAFSLPTKRTCYFAKVKDSFIEISKVGNPGRNSSPNALMDQITINTSLLRHELVAPLTAVLKSDVLPGSIKYGTYIPIKLAQAVLKEAKTATTGTHTYTMQCIGDTYKVAKIKMQKRIGGKIVAEADFAEISDFQFNMAPSFKNCKQSIVIDILSSMRTNEITAIPADVNGDEVWAIHEAYEEKMKKSTEPAKPTHQATDINPKKEGITESKTLTISTPTIATKASPAPISINRTIILI